MYRSIVTCLLVILGAGSARAATLQAILKDQDAGNTTPGSTHRIQIWVKTDFDGTANLGIASAEFEILSSGTGKAQYTGITSFVTVGALNPVTTMGYSTINPVRQDGAPTAGGIPIVGTWVPQPVAGATADGDTDAIGLFLSAAPGNVFIDPTSANYIGTIGSPQGPGKTTMNIDADGFAELAVENWTFQQTETLNFYIDSAPSSATFFGPVFDSNGYNTSKSYRSYGAQNISATGLVVPIPEPASLVLMTLGGLGLILACRADR
jgi:hypothetical protein